MKRLLFLSAIALLSASSCKKCEDATPATKLKYAQTQCADAWGTADSDAGTIRLVRQYLSRRGLPVTDIYMKTEGSADLCQACTCHTGKAIYILTPSDEVERFTSLGFRVAR